MAATFFSKSFALAAAISTLTNIAQAIPYRLTQSFAGPTFFNNFDFITNEPSGGWVSYLDQATAQGLGYATASVGGVHLGVDHVSYLNPSGAGRRSVRIESKQAFNKGLFIGDFAHMPQGCGTWPAFWMFGPNWPYGGEIDILEGVNNQPVNQISAHTGPGCTIAGTQSRANIIQNACYQPTTNSGCYYRANGPFTYGNNFNAVGGGVYAMQWTSNWISIWFWRRGTVPGDVRSDNPNPATWGRPMAMFAGSGCSMGHFANMKIVINTSFCGPWGGATFAQQGCGSSCINYVASNPSAFASAFWQINSIKVYQPAAPFARVAFTNTTDTDFDDTSFNETISDATTSILASTATPAIFLQSSTAPLSTPTVFVQSSVLKLSTATPLASVVSINAPDAALGATESVSIGPTPDPTSVPTLITSLVSNPVTSATDAGAVETRVARM